jgi:hypothetical protein
MTNIHPSDSSGRPPDLDADDSSSPVHEAKQQARDVAETGKQQAAHVADEAKAKTSQLLGEARDQARDRADGQVAQLAGILDRVSGELGEMADGTSSDNGYMAALARDGSTAAKNLSQRLDREGLDGAIDDLRRFARRRPVVFLATAFGIGIALGRLTRNADLGEIMSDDEDSERDSANAAASRQQAMTLTSSESSASSPPVASPSESTLGTGRLDVPGEPDLVPPSTTGAGTTGST